MLSLQLLTEVESRLVSRGETGKFNDLGRQQTLPFGLLVFGFRKFAREMGCVCDASYHIRVAILPKMQ